MAPFSLGPTGNGKYLCQPSDNPDNGNQFEPSDPQYYLTVNVYDTITNSRRCWCSQKFAE
ncbi:MAG: hypothetical protein ACO1G6_06580 [Bacteroidota bacterium]